MVCIYLEQTLRKFTLNQLEFVCRLRADLLAKGELKGFVFRWATSLEGPRQVSEQFQLGEELRTARAIALVAIKTIAGNFPLPVNPGKDRDTPAFLTF